MDDGRHFEGSAITKGKSRSIFFSVSFITRFWSQCYFFEGGRQFEITRARHNQTQQPIYNISVSFIRSFGLNLISWKVFFSPARFSPLSSVRDRSNFSIAQGNYPQLSTSSCPQLFNYVPEGTSDSVCVLPRFLQANFCMRLSFCDVKILLHSPITYEIETEEWAKLGELLKIEQVWLRLGKNEADYINYKLI